MIFKNCFSFLLVSEAGFGKHHKKINNKLDKFEANGGISWMV